MAALPILWVCWPAGRPRYWGHKSGSLLSAVLAEEVMRHTEQ
jgi:hypothetical protein